MVRTSIVAVAVVMGVLAFTTIISKSFQCVQGGWSPPLRVWTASAGQAGAAQIIGRPELVTDGAEQWAIARAVRVGSDWSTADLVSQRIGHAAPIRPSSGATFAGAVAALDKDRGLHMVWADFDPHATEGNGRTRPELALPLQRVLHSTYRNGAWTNADTIYRAYNLLHYGSSRSNLAVDSGERLHFAFSSLTESGPPLLVYAQFSNGEWRISEFTWKTLNGPVPLGAGYPWISFGSGGRVYLAFVGAVESASDHRRLRGNPNSIFLMTSDDDGESWGAPTLLHLSRGRPASQLQIVTGADDNELHLVWAESVAGNVFPSRVKGMRSTDGGVTWSLPTIIFERRDDRLIRTVRAIQGNAGEVYVATSVAGGVFISHFSARGWSSPRLLRREERAAPFDLAFDPDNRLHLLWEHSVVGPEQGRPIVGELLFSVQSACPRVLAKSTGSTSPAIRSVLRKGRQRLALGACQPGQCHEGTAGRLPSGGLRYHEDALAPVHVGRQPVLGAAILEQ